MVSTFVLLTFLLKLVRMGRKSMKLQSQRLQVNPASIIALGLYFSQFWGPIAIVEKCKLPPRKLLEMFWELLDCAGESSFEGLELPKE